MNTVAEVPQEQADGLAQIAQITIEYGGLTWVKSDDRDELEYRAEQPGCGSFRIYLYPKTKKSCSCAGRWLWSVRFDTLVAKEFKPEILNMEASAVVGDDIEEAMQTCLDAKEKFIADIKQLSLQLGIGNYPTGYMDGQAALAKKIAMVLP